MGSAGETLEPADLAEPAVSVVIATFDGAAFIGEQLHALANENLPGGFEVIVADNGSSDSTLEVCRRFAGSLDLRIVDASAQRGQSFARNRGAAEARGPLLLFLDQDDVVGAGYVASMAAALSGHDVVAASMDTDVLNDGWVAKARTVSQQTHLPHDFGADWAYACTLGVRADVFRRAGGFDESVRPAGEDVELCIRLHALGHELAFNPAATLRYRYPTTLRALRRQGIAYGLGHIAVCTRHDVRPTIGDALGWVRTAVAAAAWTMPWMPMERRGQGAFALGRRLGLLRGFVATRQRPRAR